MGIYSSVVQHPLATECGSWRSAQEVRSGDVDISSVDLLPLSHFWDQFALGFPQWPRPLAMVWGQLTSSTSGDERASWKKWNINQNALPTIERNTGLWSDSMDKLIYATKHCCYCQDREMKSSETSFVLACGELSGRGIDVEACGGVVGRRTGSS